VCRWWSQSPSNHSSITLHNDDDTFNSSILISKKKKKNCNKKNQTSFKSQTFVPLVLFHPQTSSSNSHQSLISLQRGHSPILYLVIDYIYTQTCIYRERKKRCSKVTFFKFTTFFGILKVFELCHEIKLLGIV
jgi:hypothetical protein